MAPPSVASRSVNAQPSVDREPQVEAAGRQRRSAARPGPEDLGHPLQPAVVALRAGPRRGRRRRGRRRRRPGPGRAPSSRRACAPPAGSARARGRRRRSRSGRRPGWSAWTASGPRRRPSSPCSRMLRAGPVPGELDVALVGEHRDAVGPAPRRRPRRGRRAPPVGLPGLFTHRHSARSASAGSIGVEVDAAGRRHRHRHRPARRRGWPPSRRSGTTWPGTARCRDRATAAAATAAACRRTPWCRCTHRSAAIGTSTPKRRSIQRGAGLAERGRCRCSAGSPARCPDVENAATTAGGGGVDRRADREVDGAAVERVGDRHQPVEPVVRVGRGDEAGRAGASRRDRSRDDELGQPAGRGVGQAGPDAEVRRLVGRSTRPRPRGGWRRARRPGRTARRARRRA